MVAPAFRPAFPYVYYSVVPDSTLTTKIRERSWNLDRLFPVFKKTKAEFRRLKSGLSKDNLHQLRSKIDLLAAEIRSGFKDLKLINFYDSALFYLYFRLLQHVFALCKKEGRRLAKVRESAQAEEAKKIERKIKDCKKTIGGLDVAEAQLIAVDAKLVNILRKSRWRAEKRAQREFSFQEMTLRSMENLNRKVKVEVMKVKKYVPEKVFLLRRLQRQGKTNPGDAILLARLISGAIENIGKDVAYSTKLISQFQDEMEKLKEDVENLKKRVVKLEKDEQKSKDIAMAFEQAVLYVEQEAHNDAMKIFRNIFVEYKEVATHPIGRVA